MKFILSQYAICLISTTFFVCNSWKQKRVSVISHHPVCKFPAQSVIGQHQYQLMQSKAEVHIIARQFPHAKYIKNG